VKRLPHIVKGPSGIKVVAAYVSKVSDTDGRVCSADDVKKYADPLIQMMPQLSNRFSRPDICMFAKKLERLCTLDSRLGLENADFSQVQIEREER
jgi:hypothetical protein